MVDERADGELLDKRQFLKLVLAGGAGALLSRSAASAKGRRLLALPPPQRNPFSTEIVLNSRVSVHSGYSGTLPDQVIANAAWAAARPPLMGTARTIYVATSQGVHLYDPLGHQLVMHRAGNLLSNPSHAFEIGVAGDLEEDAGASLHCAQLATVSFWSATGGQVASCPKNSARDFANNNWAAPSTVHMVNAYGRVGATSGITDRLVALSSDGSLPAPATRGTRRLEDVLLRMRFLPAFASLAIDLYRYSQLAWAAYGCVPHHAYNGAAALTAASYMAQYFLAGRIYIVHPLMVARYCVRDRFASPSSRDHRIEPLAYGDHRPALRAALTRLPDTAQGYLVFCADAVLWNRKVEAGFCGASALLQANSLDLEGHLAGGFNSNERGAIRSALGIPAGEHPLVVFSVGHPMVQ